MNKYVVLIILILSCSKTVWAKYNTLTGIKVLPISAGQLQINWKKRRLISLNFQNIPIRSVLQILAEFIGINMVLSDNVSGNITLTLHRIPWEEVLDIILKTKGLERRLSKNIMEIAPASSLQKVANLLPLRSDLLQIHHAKASDIARLLQDKQASLLSKRGVLRVDARTNSLWIRDTDERIQDIHVLVRRLDVPVRQVVIEARIVEVSKEFSRDLGIAWGAKLPEASDRLPIDFAAASMVGNAASFGLALATLSDNILLDLELKAMESEGRGEIIASPHLLTAEETPALIEAGEEIPYQESTSSGATAVSFKKAVLSLQVTPHVSQDKTIRMDLQINQDRPSVQKYNGVPAIFTKEIKTTVFVHSGQTLVLGGIYKREKNALVRRVPFLGQLPLLGVLFKQQNHSDKNEELLIFITPRIIGSSPLTGAA